eukprot:9493266-Pyramimonas_sp.AAC.1
MDAPLAGAADKAGQVPHTGVDRGCYTCTLEAVVMMLGLCQNATCEGGGARGAAGGPVERSRGGGAGAGGPGGRGAGGGGGGEGGAAGAAGGDGGPGGGGHRARGRQGGGSEGV